MKATIRFFTILLLTVVGAAHAAGQTVQFSADTYQKDPKGNETRGRLYAGDGRMRMEMTQNGQKVIQIIDAPRQTTWILFPAQRAYMEQRGANPAQAAMERKDGRANPCQGIPGSQCRKLGEETIAGRKAIKWEMTFNYQGKTLQGTQWIDAGRGMVLRQEMPNGDRSSMKFLGLEKLDGRTVEKWEMSFTQQGKTSQRSYRWYDPELNLVIKEEYPGGFVREMRNIRIAPQDPTLFQVPAGYKKFTPQQQAPAGRR